MIVVDTYDCEFVALAHMLDAPLFTMDGKLLKSFSKTAQPLAQDAVQC